ncbi:MAG: peptidoglycan-binding domain-containing protein, partial [Subdoligranulum sp.]|nr:peptidoglycan-binding domain-containing protein [Subdoligranulum sp.]MDY6126270.1 peptidoglycan-binding domain-containing protein [Gemmiger qucibialis]
RRKIYNAAVATGAWGYVEPLSMTPTWVHFDRRYGTPACKGTTAGYPTCRVGSVSTYVLVMQDALNALGYVCGSPDGKFGPRTKNALMAWQHGVGLTADGICGCNSWKKLTAASVGIGRTGTVKD